MLTNNQIYNIKLMLLKQNQKQQELASKLGITRQYLSAILSKKKESQRVEEELKNWLVNNM